MERYRAREREIEGKRVNKRERERVKERERERVKERERERVKEREEERKRESEGERERDWNEASVGHPVLVWRPGLSHGHPVHKHSPAAPLPDLCLHTRLLFKSFN